MAPDPTRRLISAGLALAFSGAPAFAGEPRRAPEARFEKGAASTGWLDFDFHRESQIFIPAQVNGAPVDVWLDSGVSHLVLDTAFAAPLGLTRRGKFTVTGLTGSSVGSHVGGPVEIRLGSLVLSPKSAAVFDLSDPSQALARPVNVVLGRDLFDHVIVDIDFASRKIAFHDARRFSRPVGAIAVPLRPSGQVHSVPVIVEGRSPIQATFDLGNDGALDLSPRYASSEKLLEGRRTSTTVKFGVEGQAVATAVVLSSVGFGGATLREVPADVRPGWANDDNRIATPANIGLRILSRFRLITDYKRGRLWVLPNTAAIPRPFRKNRAGVQSKALTDHLEVLHISGGGPAERAGLKVGDHILAVNGRRVDAAYPKQAYRWTEAAPGTQVELTLQDGSNRRFILEDYY